MNARYHDGQLQWRGTPGPWIVKTEDEMRRLRARLHDFRAEAWTLPLIAELDAALAAFDHNNNMEIAA